jgi:hypothetical protein
MYPFKSAEITLHKKYLHSILAVDTARLADLVCPILGTEKKKNTLQMFA